MNTAVDVLRAAPLSAFVTEAIWFEDTGLAVCPITYLAIEAGIEFLEYVAYSSQETDSPDSLEFVQAVANAYGLSAAALEQARNAYDTFVSTHGVSEAKEAFLKRIM